MTYRVTSAAGHVTSNLVLAVGWALAAAREPGEWAAIEDAAGKVTLERQPDPAGDEEEEAV